MEEASIDWDFIYFWISCFWNLFIGGGGGTIILPVEIVSHGGSDLCVLVYLEAVFNVVMQWQ